MERNAIRNAVLTELAGSGTRYVPLGVSARHVHLSREDLDCLFGPGHVLKPYKALSQPGQYAAEECVAVVGPKGAIENVRVLGPVRGQTQVEMATSDLARLGIECRIRMSGDLIGTPGCILRGCCGEVRLDCGVIAAARHLHMSTAQAAAFGLCSGDAAAIRVEGMRSCVLEQVICRCGDTFELELHLDTDEANAAGLKTGDLVQLTSCGNSACNGNCSCGSNAGSGSPDGNRVPASGPAPLELVTEQDVNDAVRQGRGEILCTVKAIVTPAAWDRADTLNVTIKKK